ncbi:hypothetical protein KIW84_054999 [Lathyrus oleraceus]|uniref:Helitron helicase-like domain-containing protein n=1 Tax=Pisum sativum TaxID=3888 RepID=A0A9D4WX32_PEA|nr:hypothetical protein KIW84_054999 [Pisum sativum]
MLDQNNVHAKAFRMTRDMLKNYNVKDLKLRLIFDRQTDGRVYNKPTISKVVALIIGDIDTDTKRDIIIQERGDNLQRIDEFHPSYLAFKYPLLFPYGEDGYKANILHAYEEDAIMENVLGKASVTESMFTVWLIANEKYEEARTLTSGHFVTKFIYDKKTRCWKPRKKGNTIRWLIWVPPTTGELLYLRMMLTVVKGTTTYEDIRKVGGTRYIRFRDACFAIGFLEDDK